MAWAWNLQGSFVASPLFGFPSGQPFVTVPLQETQQLINQSTPQYTLSDSSPVDVGLGGLTGVNVMCVQVLGSKVALSVTSADGTDQVVPVDDLWLWVCLATPITAVSMTLELGGTETVVQFFLGQTS